MYVYKKVGVRRTSSFEVIQGVTSKQNGYFWKYFCKINKNEKLVSSSFFNVTGTVPRDFLYLWFFVNHIHDLGL